MAGVSDSAGDMGTTAIPTIATTTRITATPTRISGGTGITIIAPGGATMGITAATTGVITVATVATTTPTAMTMTVTTAAVDVAAAVAAAVEDAMNGLAAWPVASVRSWKPGPRTETEPWPALRRVPPSREPAPAGGSHPMLRFGPAPPAARAGGESKHLDDSLMAGCRPAFSQTRRRGQPCRRVPPDAEFPQPVTLSGPPAQDPDPASHPHVIPEVRAAVSAVTLAARTPLSHVRVLEAVPAACNEAYDPGR